MAGRKLPILQAATASICLALVLGVAVNASAERVQKGNLIVTLNGGISPRKLPRNKRVPVKVRLAGRVLTADNTPLPRVNWIRLELAWRGVLSTKGLEVCPRGRLVNRISQQALRACGSALVGSGTLYAQIFVPNQRPFGVRARLLAFNGKTKGGRPAVLVHAFAPNPPVAFVIPFSVHHKKGTFRTVLITTIRRSVGPWPHVANFQIGISRHYRYRGRWRSYTSASCPAPTGFTAGFSSARATYVFAGRRELTVESVRSCRTQ